MKKLLSIVLLLSLITLTSVSATLVDYDYTISDGVGFDLETGQVFTNWRYTTTNRITINGDDTDVSAETFHHVLYWGNNNQYLGYQNSLYSTLEFDTYLGPVTSPLTIPDGAKSMAFLIYKEANDEIIPDLGVSYNDIFEPDPSEINDGDFTIDTNADGIADAWSIPGDYSSAEITDYGRQRVYADTDATDIGIYQSQTLTEGNIYYYEAFTYSNRPLEHFVTFGSAETSEFNGVTFAHHHGTFTATASTNLTIFVDGDLMTTSDWMDVRDVVLYDLTTMFGTPEPSASEFAELLHTYRVNDDPNMEYATGSYTYRDIFGDSLFGAGRNNLIENGDFSNGSAFWDASYWTYTTLYVDSSEYLRMNNNNGSSLVAVQTTSDFDIDISNYYYVTYDAWVDTKFNEGFRISYNTGGSFKELAYINNEIWTTQSYVHQPNYDYDYIRLYVYSGYSLDIDAYVYVDNLMLFDLTTIFGAGNEPGNATTIDNLISEFTANETLIEYYPSYFQTASLELVAPFYDYTAPAPEEFYNTDPASFLENILGAAGFADSLGYTTIAVVLLIGLVVVLATAGAHTTVIASLTVIAYLALSLVGWLPLWPIILMALAIAFWFISSVKGGSSNDQDE